MKKFDKFLEFLFHTKLGIVSLVVSVSASMFLLSGCILADICACYCDFFMCGSGIACSSIGSECDEAFCGDDYSLYKSYAEVNSYGNDCQMCACGEWCNSGSSSSSSSSSSSYSSSSSCSGYTGYLDIIVNYNGVTKTEEFYSSNSLAKGDVVLGSISVPDSYSKYFTLTGYYTESGKKVLDENGAIVDDGIFKQGRDVKLYARGDEKMFGEVVTVYFDTSDIKDADINLNPVKVYVGGTIEIFRSAPAVDNGKQFVGWCSADIEGATSSFAKVTENETVFHFYSFGAEVGDTVTLKPLYSNYANSSSGSSDQYNGSNYDYYQYYGW